MSDIKVNWFDIPVRDEDRAENFTAQLVARLPSPRHRLAPSATLRWW